MAWKDIDIFLEKQADGDIKAMIDEDAINNSLINIFSTMQGERRMIPDAFIYIHSLLFEPMDEKTAQRLGEGLVEAVFKWDDRVVIDNFNIDINEDANQYNTKLYYRMQDSENIATVEYIFQAI